jgi:hypothetical protein
MQLANCLLRKKGTPTKEVEENSTLNLPEAAPPIFFL